MVALALRAVVVSWRHIAVFINALSATSTAVLCRLATVRTLVLRGDVITDDRAGGGVLVNCYCICDGRGRCGVAVVLPTVVCAVVCYSGER